MNLDSYIKFLAESINEADGIKTESLDGKYYDWDENFEFKKDVIRDLRNRDLLGLTPSGIYAMVPVNRENAPVNRDRPFNIIHIIVSLNPDAKTINAERYFGNRDDWTQEEFSREETDWTDIPILSERTVMSLVNAYEEHDVFENLKNKIEEYKAKKEDYLKYKFADDLSVKATDNLIKVCNAIISGEYKSYRINLDFPEIPSDKDKEARMKHHQKYADAMRKGVDDYYKTYDND